jgi:hypothetical protein
MRDAGHQIPEGRCQVSDASTVGFLVQTPCRGKNGYQMHGARRHVPDVLSEVVIAAKHEMTITLLNAMCQVPDAGCKVQGYQKLGVRWKYQV